MNAKDYLSGVYLDTKKFSKKETIELMEDYFKYKTEYNKQSSSQTKLFTKKIANLVTGVGFAIVIILIFTLIFINLI